MKLEIDMKKIACILLSLMVTTVSAAELKLNWGDMKKFTDVVTTDVNQDDFEKHLKQEFLKMLTKQAQQLPAGQTLELTISDIDLAGHVPPETISTGRTLRIVKQAYWPRISFEYSLVDKDGKLLLSGKEDLKDMGFLNRIRKVNQSNEFDFEENMLKKWMKNLDKKV
jgi:hypothetical protein